MDIVRYAILRPVTVVVGVILLLLFGFISLKKLPYQLSPNVAQPQISISTFWPGATPYEVERDIIEQQEKFLKGVPNLRKMESNSSNASGSITLTFKVGTDIDNALLRVSNKMNEVPSYPENVDRPVIRATGAESSPVIWMILKAGDDNPRSIDTYRTFFENDVRQYLERIDGVSDLFVFGGREREMHIIVSPEKLAAVSLTLDDVINVLQGQNANISAGNMEMGRRQHRIRTVAEFRSVEDIQQVVLKTDGRRRVLLADVAQVQFGYQKLNAAIINNHKRGIAVGVRPEPNANILDLTDRVEEVVADLNNGKLAEQDIYLDWAYDQRPYIRGAINLLKQNILIGGCLAIIVLFVFLRSVTSTLVVATAIPISIIGTFIIMDAVGSSLNVVSLAGIAFAVGMLVDNAIVVLENIDRHRRMGQRPRDAAYSGTREVWGAVLASTLTTVAVFLPVFFLEEEAGQLFRDIAIAVSAAVMLSLFVSVLVIPMLTRQLYRIPFLERLEQRSAGKGPGGSERLGVAIREKFMALLGLVLKNGFTRITTVVFLACSAVLIARVLMPKMEYLPQGNRNLLINIMIPPPGISYAERQEIGEYLFREFDPYFGPGDEKQPGIRNMFYVGSDRIMLFGMVASQEARVRELMPVCKRVMDGVPGFFGITTQAGVFQSGIGRGRTIDLDFKGPEIDALIGAAGTMFGKLKSGSLSDAQVRPLPSIEQIFPETQFIPIGERLRAVNMNARQLGIALDVLMDGRQIGDFKEVGEKKIDLILKASEHQIDTPEQLYQALIATPDGQVVPVSSLTRQEDTAGITQIRHLERDRTMTLRITPPKDLTLQETMEIIEDEMLPEMRSKGMLDGIEASLSGSADKLTIIRETLQWNFLLAILITYLLMSALFGNFIYPMIIMVTVPLAAAGGFIGLRLVDRFIAPQQLDVLTMLGFVILIGVVVNNAILIVHQALNNVRSGKMDHATAVLESTRSRLRPIYMSALTSIFGMLPLVLVSGSGSELYRGLGSVVLGGLAVSTVFTVFVIPSLLMFCIRMEKIPEKPAEEVVCPEQVS